MRARSPLVLVATLSAVAAFLPRPAAAQSSNPPSGGSPAAPAAAVPVYDVYVTTQQDVVSQVTTTREVTRDDMQWEGARTLDEAVVRQPSLVVRTGGEGSPRIDIRGLRTRQILTLIDGVPFYSTEDAAFDPSLIPTQIMERVDITYSNSSVLYGDGPIAGILQIRTRAVEEGLHPESRADFRSGGQNLGEAAVSGTAEGLQGFAAARYYHGNGWYLPDSYGSTALQDAGHRDNSDRNQVNLFGKLGYPIDDRARVDALVDYRHAVYGAPWRVEQQNDWAGRTRFERVDPLDGFTTQVSGQLDATEKLTLRSWAFVTRQSEDRSSYDDATLDTQLRRDTFDLTGTALISGGAFHGRYDAGEIGVFRFAANGRYEHFHSDGRIRDVPLGGGNFGFRQVDARDGYGAWSLAGEYELRPVEPVGLVVGYGHAFLDGAQNVSDGANLFLGGVTVELPTRTHLRGSAALKGRFPSLQQLYAVDGGNADLDPERCWCFELGVTQELPYHATLGVTGFWLSLRDFIERNDANVYENRQKLQSRGVEVELEIHPWEPLVLRTAYTYLDARDLSSGSPFDRLDNRPRHKVDAEARFSFATGTSFRFAMTWLGNNLIYSRTAPIRSRELGDFALFDLRLAQELLGGRASVYFGIDNLTDQGSEVNVYFPQPGRVFYGGVDLRI